MLQSEIGKTYWSKDAVYYKQYSHLYDNLVPAKGSCKTLHGELILAISRLQYEYFNNGNCNACETPIETETCRQCSGSGEVSGYDGEEEDCDYCDGQGTIEEDGESHVSQFYGQFLELIEKSVPMSKMLCEEILEVICTSSTFSDEQAHKYTALMDLVVFRVLSTTDSEIPDWYKKM